MEKSGEVGGEHERHPPSTISLTPSHVGDTLSHAGHPPSTNSDTFSHGTTHLTHSLITVSYLQHFAQDPFTELRPFIGGEKYSTRVLEGRRFGQIESPIIFQPLLPDDKGQNLERIPWISLEDLLEDPGQEREMPMLCIGRLFGLASQRNEGSVHPFTLHNALPRRALPCWLLAYHGIP